MKITVVDKPSPAHRAGIRPGDTLERINGHLVRDVLDYKFYSYDARLMLTVLHEDGSRRNLLLKKEEGQDLGLTFEDYLMDKARHCANKCIFCFIDQLPRGMRPSLYFKDDDMRLSFLLGNYITMTNLSDEDLDRIVAMRISPLNISVQATEPELRRLLLGNPKAVRIMEQMRKLSDAGVRMNCQIVVCNGINDGEHLRRSLTDLLELFPQVGSISVVPAGLTKHREGLYPLKPVDKTCAEAILDLVEPIGEECLAKYGTRVVYCADELYLTAERPLPPAEHYEEYPQLENGVGMMALMEDEMRSLVRSLRDFSPKWNFSLATGFAAANFMRKMLDLIAEKCHNNDSTPCGRVYAIRNDFFGETVTVAGLVTGGDLIAQLTGRDLGERLLIPSCMLRHGENVFLDDLTTDDVSARLGVPVVIVPGTAQGLLDAVAGRL